MPAGDLDRRSTSTKPRRRWRARRYLITADDVDAARELFGILAAVEIRLTRYAYDTCGRLIGFRNGVWIIGLDTYTSPRQASLTLWHELVHVAQAERAGGTEQPHDLVLKKPKPLS
jgi:hypothetical protein